MRILLIHRSIRSIEVFDPGRASARSASETDGEESRQNECFETVYFCADDPAEGVGLLEFCKNISGCYQMDDGEVMLVAHFGFSN